MNSASIPRYLHTANDRPTTIAMLHRRTTSSAPGGSGLGGPPPNLPSNTNKAYTPLRRPSQNLYNTPTSASSKARYNLPSPSPSYLSPNVNTGTYFQQPRNSIDLSEEGLGGGAGSGGWAGDVRSAFERMRAGLRDGLKLDRSLNLVWG